MNNSQYTNARLHSMMSRSGQGQPRLPQRAWGFVTAGIVLLVVTTVWQFELFGFAGDSAYAQRPELPSAEAATSAESFLPLISTASRNADRLEDDSASPAAAPMLPEVQRSPRAFTRTAAPLPDGRAAAETPATQSGSPAPVQHWAEARDPFSAAPVQVAAVTAPTASPAPIQQVQQTTQSFDLFAPPATAPPAQAVESSPAQGSAPAADPFFAPPAAKPTGEMRSETLSAPAETLSPAPLNPSAATQNEAFFPASTPEPTPVFAAPAREAAPVFGAPSAEPVSAQPMAAQPDPFGFAPVETAPAATTPAPAVQSMPPQAFTEDPYLTRPAPLAPLDRPSLSTPPATGVSMNQSAVADERIYEVQPGDNYWSISRYFYGTARYFAALAEYNRHRIPDPDKMRPGMKVLGPDPSVLHDRYPKLTGADPSKPVVQQPSGFFVDQHGQPAFRVGKGDTLTSIAQLHLGRVSRWTQVYAMNKQVIADPNNLKIDTILRLPADACQVQVVSGDTLFR